MKILFVSLMGGESWGGSEELWSQTAAHLSSLGHEVTASVYRFPETAPGVLALKIRSIPVQERNRGRPSLLRRIGSRINNTRAPDRETFELAAWIRRTRPDFICVSNGVGIDSIDALECITSFDIPWCNVSQCGIEWCWPTNEILRRAGPLFQKSARWFFVSEKNRRLFETQWGVQLPNSEIVRNPYKVSHDLLVPWPDETAGLKLACVARLDPACKGQDLLLEALAQPTWKNRPLTLSLFGSGESSLSLERLINRLNLGDRVFFQGYVSSIEEIWRSHHMLVMPSRHEGLPLALVEAALCGRPSIATDVGGNHELIEEGHTGFLALAPTLTEINAALERAWNQRLSWREKGLQARARAQTLIPPDPIILFASRLIALGSSQG